MKVEIKIDPSFTDAKLVICCDRMTPEIEALVRSIQSDQVDQITAHSDRGVEFLPINSLLRVYSQNQKVFAQTENGTFMLRARLYEMAQQLSLHRFVRISNSEIVNARMITGMVKPLLIVSAYAIPLFVLAVITFHRKTAKFTG